MDGLRSVMKWVSKHQVLSFLVAVFVLGSLSLAKSSSERSQGTLSEPLKRGMITDAVYGIGTVTATHSYSLKPGVTETITDLFVKEGDAVKKGTKLANVDNVIYRAPFDGVINYLPFKVGENIFSQLPVLVVTDLKNRYMVVTLEQQGALRVRPGQKAKLSFDSLRNQFFEGVVESVYSYNGNFLARIDVSSLPPEILPDMTADIAIMIREVKDALLIPVAAFEDGNVWVKRGPLLPQRVPVQLGIVDSSTAEVVSGDLHVGDQLIIRKKVTP